MLKYYSIKKVYEENAFIFESFKSAEDLRARLLSDIDLDESIDVAGSVSILELGLYEALKDRGQDIYWHWKDQDKTRQGKIYFTSSNALTRDGKLVNLDGTGNRVAGMIHGYDRVYIIVGKNKLVDDYEAARERIRQIAAPLNAKRLKLNTPCVKLGRCVDCDSDERICRAETIIHKNPAGSQLIIYLLDEDLGY